MWMAPRPFVPIGVLEFVSQILGQIFVIEAEHVPKLTMPRRHISFELAEDLEEHALLGFSWELEFGVPHIGPLPKRSIKS